ncbi:MAG: M50 family metallopeptidase [Kiritimatiellia bacterium]
METIYTVLGIVACVLLFSLAVFIHEFGHFIVAKALGFKVEVFSIGFGPALWKKSHGGVEYRISAIPFGGYVALPQLDPEGTKAIENGSTETDGKLEEAPAWKRIAVAFAGPFGNVVLAVALALGLSLAPAARFGETPAVIGEVVPGGPAAVGGLQCGDRVVGVNGHGVRTWTDMQTELQISGGKDAAFEVERAGGTVTLSIRPKRDEVTGAWYMLALSSTNLTTGASAWMPSRNPLKQLRWDVMSISRVLKALVTPREAGAAANALGGPVMIAEGLYRQVRHNGWDAIGFLRFLNVNLAMLNLLPIPVLDGGLILFALFELLFRRKVSKRIVDGLSLGFMWLFLALMVFLVFRDVRRSVRIHGALADLEVRREAEGRRRLAAGNFRPAFDLGGCPAAVTNAAAVASPGKE